MSPGISVSAIVISLRPQSANPVSLTLKSVKLIPKLHARDFHGLYVTGLSDKKQVIHRKGTHPLYHDLHPPHKRAALRKQSQKQQQG